MLAKLEAAGTTSLLSRIMIEKRGASNFFFIYKKVVVLQKINPFFFFLRPASSVKLYLYNFMHTLIILLIILLKDASPA